MCVDTVDMFIYFGCLSKNPELVILDHQHPKSVFFVRVPTKKEQLPPIRLFSVQRCVRLCQCMAGCIYLPASSRRDLK